MQNILIISPLRYRTAQTKIEATKITAYRLMDLVEAKKKHTADGSKCIHWRYYFCFAMLHLFLLSTLIRFMSWSNDNTIRLKT